MALDSGGSVVRSRFSSIFTFMSVKTPRARLVSRMPDEDGSEYKPNYR